MRFFTDTMGVAAHGAAAFLCLALTSVGAYGQQAPDSFDIELVDSEMGFEYLHGYTDPSDGYRDYDPDVLYRVEYGVDENGNPLTAAVPKTARFTLNGEDFLPLIRTGRDPEGEPFDQVIPIRLVDAPDDKASLQLCTSDNASGTDCNDAENINKNSFYHAYDGSTPLVGENDGSEDCPSQQGCPIARFRSEQVICFKCIANSFKVNRGTDNLFSNSNQARTRNNIGRVDLLLDDPIVISTAQGQAFDSSNPEAILNNVGFLVMERGGNDNISLTAVKGIRELDSIAGFAEPLDETEFPHLSANQRRDLPKLARTMRTYDSPEFEVGNTQGNPGLIAEGHAATRVVTEVGDLLQTNEGSFSGTNCSGRFWGDTEQNFRTAVFMNANPAEGNPGHFIENRPDQNLGAQNVCGTFVSLADLGIGLDDEFFGVAIFAGDVNETMDLITLTDIPRNTSGASGGVGGLDLMGGGGFFFREDIPALSLDKIGTLNDDDVIAGVSAGDTITYRFTVKNTGPVPLTNITLSDAVPGVSISGGSISSLAPSASDSSTFTGSYELTQSDIDEGSFTNTATATSEEGAMDDDNDRQTLTQNPNLELTKTADPSTFSAAGDEISYSFTVRNAGNVTLSGLTLNDDLLGGPVSCAATELAPNATTDCGPATYTIEQSDVDAGQVDNTATATANPPQGEPVSAQAEATVTSSATPNLELTKTADPSTFSAAGDEISYSFTVRNAGNVTLSGLTLNDDLLGGPVSCAATELAPNATTVCGPATYTIEQSDVDAGQVDNTATATANPPQGEPVSAQAEATVTSSATPNLELTKTADPSTFSAAGDEISYSFTVRNAGNVTLSGLTLNDDLLGGPVSCAATELAPNATTVCGPATYTIEQSDVDAGQVDNTATATANPPQGEPVSAQAEATVISTISSGVTVVKTSSPPSGTFVEPNDLITYTVVVTVEDGATPEVVVLEDTLKTGLTFGEIADSGEFAADVGGAPVLTFTLRSGTEPGTYEVSYTATVDDDAAETVANSVVVTGNGGDPEPECNICKTEHPIDEPADPLADPEVSVTKTSNPNSGSLVSAGQNITYGLSVEITEAPLIGELVLEDALGAGLTFGGVTDDGEFTLDASSALELMFTLPSGTVPGIYSLEYTATVDDDATGVVGNNVAVAASGGDPDPDCSICSTGHPLDEPADPTPPSPTVAVPVDNRFGLMLLAMLLMLVGIHAARRSAA